MTERGITHEFTQKDIAFQSSAVNDAYAEGFGGAIMHPGKKLITPERHSHGTSVVGTTVFAFNQSEGEVTDIPRALDEYDRVLSNRMAGGE